MSKKCKKMLQEAGVPALAELDDFVEAIQGVFDSLEEFQHGFLDLGAKDRMDLLKEINPDKALKWPIKVTTNITLLEKCKPQKQVFTPLLQQPAASGVNRPKEDVPPIKIENKLLYLDKEYQFCFTGYYMTPEQQSTYMTNFMGSK